eukprot:CAMPEP_0202439384 /NCGR_PEP_ID=MMETSP1345-20130828/36135_1 /ASSEMBLY_ACC=CAM_ASM_000843 /TAXON_ID=342563 /ORGANISM="Fabrea Fabrea salina" /LENGTH=159 /DNA_ID=CAMNT_0049053911 /DNA_START=737 /DNA_END=1213 /DNA_ORIENTATION=+
MEPRLIVSGSTDKTVRIWRESKKLFTFREMGNLRPILEVLKFLSPEEVIGIARVNKQFYESCFHSEVLKPGLIQTKALEGHSGAVYSVAVSLKKGIIVSASQDSTIQVWNLATGQVIQVLKGHSDWVWSVAISSDGNWVVSASRDNTLRVWSLASGLTT